MIAAVLLLINLVVCQYELDWSNFKTKYGRVYEKEEEGRRFNIFKDNLNFIHLLNKIDRTATYGVNKFADLTSEEFAQFYLGSIPNSENGLEQYEPNSLSAPAQYDYTSMPGYVSPVQDQGSCGSCWAFSATAGFETARVLAGNQLLKMSEQNLVDCDLANDGCNGGNIGFAESYIKKTGIVEASRYPYNGVVKKCTVPKDATKYRASGYGSVNKENDMVSALLTHGPLPAAINAVPSQFYESGILNPSKCDPNALNHGVTVVGYGTENGVEYWKIRNTWGQDWGEEGNFRMVKGKNMCGIANCTSYIYLTK